MVKEKIFKIGGFLLLVLFTISCAFKYQSCPDDTFVNINYYKKGSERYYDQTFQVNGSKLDTIPFVVFAISGNKILPLYDISKLPLDVSKNLTTFIFNRKTRSDTIVVGYNLTRSSCENGHGMYVQVLNPLLIKNTFNESDSLINCHISYYY
ncbi:MAG: hypothetical protein H7329_01975 [Opitutaceae bacterium]|nr:hypothetical protein [Cytophagales bacterium]